MEFFDREREKEEILNILRTEPQLINFIYGPINSGKTTLITDMIENLPDDYVVFYINLRGKLIKEYGGFVRVLFKVKRKEISEKVIEKGEKLAKRALVLAGRYLSGIPIEKDMLDGFLDAESTEDVFEFLEEYFLKISEEKIPVLIIDELQVIGDLKINGKAIYKLFNFFIRLTKELHICHVFALSSDSLFIENVYSEAMLEGRANYILVDDFDEQTTKKFLEKYNISKEEQELGWNYFGGKPGYLSDIVNTKFTGKDIKKAIEKTLKIRKGQIEEIIYTLKDEDKEMFKGCTDVLKKFKDKDNFDYLNVTKYIRFLVGKNIIFVNCAEKNIKAQSKINLLAMREILKEIGE
ncbi:MAG: ATP-binding protein [Euryarchaeota archaeon HGW-Euryarchaeota-1]|nr:MAG: ATP-binding protein [Euryarchaeota archaeon HGW-Euryarchaeota-1]